VPYEPPVRDQINRSRGHRRRTRPPRALFISPARRTTTVPHTPKRCSTTPGQNGKDLVSTARPGYPASLENQMPGVADLARPNATGGYPSVRPPKPSVEPLFTCQRTFDADQRSSRKRPDRFEAGQALIVNSRKAVRESRPSRSPLAGHEAVLTSPSPDRSGEDSK
jgi:hypothetical protein